MSEPLSPEWIAEQKGIRKHAAHNVVAIEALRNYPLVLEALERRMTPVKPSPNPGRSDCSCHCGNNRLMDERFCPNCGAALDWGRKELAVIVDAAEFEHVGRIKSRPESEIERLAREVVRVIQRRKELADRITRGEIIRAAYDFIVSTEVHSALDALACAVEAKNES